MGLDERIKRLRGTTRGLTLAPAKVSSVASEPGEPSLAERLRRLAPTRAGPQRTCLPDEGALADCLGARVLWPGVLLIERRLDPRLRHGRSRLGSPEGPRFLPLPSDWIAGDPPAPWLCLDTETSGLAGGTGTWVFLTGALRQSEQGWVLRQILLTRLDAEPAYLDAIRGEFARPARLLTYNGRSFDAPLLATRFRLAGVADPLAGLPHLDLLGSVRRAFGRCWPDCRLATAESRLLGLERRDDLPGAAAPMAWLAWLRRGERAPLARVLRHNRLDLCSLAGLLRPLDAAYADPVAHGADLRAVAAAHREQGRLRLALNILADRRRLLDPVGLLDLAALYRRVGQWVQSVAIWESLEAAGDLQARAALARYHEHRSLDLERALTLTEALPFGEDRERRRARLLVKRARDAARP